MDIGWEKLLALILVALVVFGPSKLPEMMRSLGKALRSFQEESGRAMHQLTTATDLGAVAPEVDTEGDERGAIDHPDGQGPMLGPGGPAALEPAEPASRSRPQERIASPHKARTTQARKRGTTKAAKTPSQNASMTRRPGTRRERNAR